MIGRIVEICSTGGITYRGVVRHIMLDGTGELFQLSGGEDTEYVRFVYVTDRAAQVRQTDSRT